MGYDTFIAEPNSKKNLLIEIDLRMSHIKWFTYEPNIFQWDLTDFGKGTTFNFQNGSFGYGSFGYGGVADTGGIPDPSDPNIRTEDVPIKIGSITVDTIDYTEASSLAILRANDRRYLFNKVTQLLLIHFKDGKWPEEFREAAICLGITSGYTSQIPGVYDGIDYEPKIVSVPSLSESQDPLVYGVLSFKLNSFVLDNVNGDFDRFGRPPYNPFGSNARMLFGGEGIPYEVYQIVMAAKIEDFDFTETEMIVNLIDSRKAINVSLPPNVFDIATYPYLNEDNINKKILLRYGVLRRVEVVCIDEDKILPCTYTFKACDTSFHGIKSIDEVYVKDERIIPATKVSSTATFTILAQHGYQECGLSGKASETETGLAAETQYYFKITIDGGDQKEYNITTETDTTYAAVMILMNKKVSKANFHLVSGDLRCLSDKTKPGEDSTIALAAGQAPDLFATIGASFDSAVDGKGSDYIAGNKVTIDMTGYIDEDNDYGHGVNAVIDHPLDIIRDLIVNHTKAIWSSAFFEMNEWQIAINQIVSKTAISIEDDHMIDIIEKFCNTVQGLFIIRPDNIYTFKNYNTTAKVQKSITKEELEEPLHVSFEGDYYISSANIKFKRAWDKNLYWKEINNEDEDIQESKYNRVNRQDFETLLSARTDAANLGRAIVVRNKDIIPIFTVVTKFQNINLKLFDTVNFEADRINKVWFGNVKCEVIARDIDFNNFMITFQLRYIQDVIEVTLSDTAELGGYYGDKVYGDFFYIKESL